MVTRPFLLVVVVAMSALVVACTGKRSQRTQHEGPPKNTSGMETRAQETGHSVQQIYARREEYSGRINKANSAEDLLRMALELEKTVLDPNVLADPELSGRVEFATVLNLFHRALERAWQRDRNLVEKNGILSRYERVALTGCGADGGACIRLPAFKGDSLTGRLLMHVAEGLEARILKGRSRTSRDVEYLQAVSRYYQLLSLAYEMSSSQAAPDLDQKYVEYARDYFTYFRSLPPDQRQHAFHQRHRNNLSLALGHLRDRAKTGRTEQYCKFMIELNPLDMEAFEGMDMDKRALRSLLSEFIECASSKGQLGSIVAKYMDKYNGVAEKQFNDDIKDENARLEVSDLGYAYALAALKEVPHLYKNLDIELIRRADLPAFILENVYYQRIDQNMAQLYWKRVRQVNDLEFIRFVRNYARVQSAYVIKVTLANYARILEEQFKEKDGLGPSFFEDVAREVNSRSQTRYNWTAVRDRLLAVRDFLGRIYDQKYSGFSGAGRTEARTEYQSLKQELGRFSENVNIAVSAPMTLAYFYYMAKFEGRVENEWINIEGSEALKRFFRPDFYFSEPLFPFGDIRQTMNELQKLHVFDYALRIGVFDVLNFALLERDKASGVDAEVLFIRQMIEDQLTVRADEFAVEMQKLEVLERSRNFSDYLLKTCEDPLQAPLSFSLDNLKMGTLLQDKAITAPITEIYNAIKPIGAWRNNREEFESLVGILRAHLTNKSGTDASRLSPGKFRRRQAIMAAIEKDLDRFQNMERQLFTKMFNLDKMIVNQQKNCLERLLKAEDYRKSRIMEQNIEFYRNVHAAMTLLRTVPTESPGPLSVEQLEGQFTTWAREQNVAADVVKRAMSLLNQVRDTGLLAQMSMEDALNEILRIHNRTHSPYDKIGYLVTDIPTFTGKTGETLVKRLNHFNGNEFREGAWDALMRVRRMLQITPVATNAVNAALRTQYRPGISLPIGPNVSIRIGESFDEIIAHPAYRSNKTYSVLYNVDQATFVRGAMSQLAGEQPENSQFLSWYSTGGLDVDIISERLKWLHKLRDLGALEMSETDPQVCPRDYWGRVAAVRDLRGQWLPGAERKEACKAVRVSAQDMMDSFLTYLDILRIDDKEREILDWIDRPGKRQDKIKVALQYRDEPSTRDWTYFDQFYRNFYVTVNRMVYNTKDHRYEGTTTEGVRGSGDFIEFRKDLLPKVKDSLYLFPPHAEPTQQLRNHLREGINRHLHEAVEFEEAVRALEETKVHLGDFIIEKTASKTEPVVAGHWRVMKVRTRPEGGPRSGKPIYLSDKGQIKNWVESVEKFIVTDTQCDALPQEGDPDYVRTNSKSEADCRSRFEGWREQREKERLKIRDDLKPKPGE
ncbi:MAG: hypothetical protein AB7G93_12555 [Bdellovibrionales bacterium]